MPATAACSPNMPASGGSTADPGGARSWSIARVPVGRGQELLQAQRHRSRGHRARRASSTSSAAGKRQQGASTITQQVAKNFLLAQRADLRAQDPEALLALRIESTYSKDRSSSSTSTRSILGLEQLRHRRRGAELFRQVGARADARRGRLSRGAAEGARTTTIRSARRRRPSTRRNWVIDRMVENGYVTREDGEKAKKEPLDVNPRVALAELHRRRLLRRGGAPRDRRALRREEALRGRPLGPHHARPEDAGDGAQGAGRRARALRRGARLARRASRSSTSTGRDWGLALAEVPALGDVQPWRLAVVLEVDGGQARDRPAAHARGLAAQVAREREIGAVTGRRRQVDPPAPSARCSRAGDVVYVEPLEGKPGQFRLRQMPEISGAIVAMDPYTGRVLRHGRRLLLRPERVQPRDAGAAPAGLLVQAVRLRDRARQRLHAVHAWCSTRRSTIDMGPGQEAWTPSNYDGKSAGPRTLRYGIEHSKNLMTVRLAKDVGMPLDRRIRPALRHLRRHAAGAVDVARRRRDDGACA